MDLVLMIQIHYSIQIHSEGMGETNLLKKKLML
jgi:hypothetical protein